MLGSNWFKAQCHKTNSVGVGMVDISTVPAKVRVAAIKLAHVISGSALFGSAVQWLSLVSPKQLHNPQHSQLPIFLSHKRAVNAVVSEDVSTELSSTKA
nr:hypothetical protein Iba_scaffold698403CG0010 [Ipomoea batatas]GMD88266.1 hypothetical protein Iba_scaffold1605716CG0010 [Ipomoea batatas]